MSTLDKLLEEVKKLKLINGLVPLIPKTNSKSKDIANIVKRIVEDRDSYIKLLQEKVARQKKDNASLISKVGTLNLDIKKYNTSVVEFSNENFILKQNMELVEAEAKGIKKSNVRANLIAIGMTIITAITILGLIITDAKYDTLYEQMDEYELQVIDSINTLYTDTLWEQRHMLDVQSSTLYANEMRIEYIHEYYNSTPDRQLEMQDELMSIMMDEQPMYHKDIE